MSMAVWLHEILGGNGYSMQEAINKEWDGIFWGYATLDTIRKFSLFIFQIVVFVVYCCSFFLPIKAVYQSICLWKSMPVCIYVWLSVRLCLDTLLWENKTTKLHIFIYFISFYF